MSSMRREIFAWVLILVAAASWGFAGNLLLYENHPAETTCPVTTAAPTVPPGMEGTNEPSTAVTSYPEYMQTTPGEEIEHVWHQPSRAERFLGYTLCFAAFAAGAVAVFVFLQKLPFLGPDGVLVIVAAADLFGSKISDMFWLLNIGPFIKALAVILSARELYGWMRNRFRLSWCAVSRIATACKFPQLSLLILAVGLLLSGTVSVFLLRYLYMPSGIWLAVTCGLLLVVLNAICIWKYGSDLYHYEKQLANFQSGLPIAVGTGAFSANEQLLLKIRREHEEAVKTAVTSERFKVELISNVSHDLRTPLTSILGYGELLQQEQLSASGKEQLGRLNQKASYMRDLVDSLFELTKVSSGVIEAKRERIDLIRLLEQTIGLFDDQLTASGLEVRRRYMADSIPVVTDGARLHQVFANLLGNAIKYALKGTRIHLEVKALEEHYYIRMVNTASYEMDFDPEQILQRFARGDKARSGQGSGLGLAIAQTYTESVGGSFEVAVDGDQFSAIVCLPKN